MTRATDVQNIRELLQRRRRDVLETSRGARREVESLHDSEKDPEYEEGAQTELADYTLSSILETQRREVELIDGALRRMDEGVFGFCIDCAEEISVGRLEALPFALRCEEDAEAREADRKASGELRLPSL